MRKIILMLAAVVALAGCEQVPPQTPAASKITGNGYNVQQLFTHDGVTVYSFYDRQQGRTVYFTNKASDVRAQWTENCGKACTRLATVETLGTN